jgi:hypothetical protein
MKEKSLSALTGLALLVGGILSGYSIRPPKCQDEVGVGARVVCPVGAYIAESELNPQGNAAMVQCRCRMAPREYAPESQPNGDDGT